MGKMLIIFSIIISANFSAEQLKPADEKLIKDAGIPLHSDAIFVYGNKDVGFRFASNVSPQVIREWYKKQLPKWSVFDKYGSWILYEDAPDKGMADVMSVNHISVTKNDNLPGWYSLDKNMTTEIVIMIMK